MLAAQPDQRIRQTVRAIIVLLSLAVLSAGLAQARSVGAAEPELAVGQVWSIKSGTPTTAKVVIGRIEQLGPHTAVHVSIIDVPRPEGFPGEGATTVIAHAPFERSALIGSLDRLMATGATPEPEFDGGYEMWRSAEGGIFTVSVEQAIQLVFDTVGPRAPQ